MTGVAMGVQERVVSRTTPTFEEFYEASWPALFDFAATLVTGDRHAAEEIAQESMARVFARFGTLVEPRPYAFRVAANLVKRRWQLQVREPSRDPAALPQPAAHGDYDHTVDAVRRLAPRLRDVVLLHYYADLPLETVARLLHRPVGTVKARLHEARAALALTLGEDVP